MLNKNVMSLVWYSLEELLIGHFDLIKKHTHSDLNAEILFSGNSAVLNPVSPARFIKNINSDNGKIHKR